MGADDGARLFDNLCDGLINQLLACFCEFSGIVRRQRLSLVEAPVGLHGTV